MGWGSGSRLFDGIITTIKKNVTDFEARKRIYREMISEFEEMDWDTQDECLGVDSAYDEVYNEEYFDQSNV